MTPRFAASQNKIRLIAVFLFTVMLAIAFQFYKSRPQDGTDIASNAETVNESLYIGLRHASSKEIKTALPDSVGKPTLLSFSSRLCHDCQRMAPVISKLVPKHPGIHFRKIDVLDDREKYPAVFRAFKPVSVPMLVFIDRQGEIRDVLYNYQEPSTIAAAMNKLEKSGKPASSKQKPPTRAH